MLNKNSHIPRSHKFKNLESEDRTKSLWDILKWRITRKKVVWPKWIETIKQPLPIERVNDANSAVITYVNHATVLIQVGGLNILTDPIWSERCSPIPWLGPKRIHAPGIALENLPPIDIILLSHDHYDHLDRKTLIQLHQRFQPQILTGLGVKNILNSFGKNFISQELDWWQTISIHDTQITFVPARHWSGRKPIRHNQTLWGGFIISSGPHTIYFAGDTAFGKHFHLIKERFNAITLAILPIGAYEPNWFMKNTHINPQEAVQAHIVLGAKYSLGIHFHTFANLADEQYGQPLNDLMQALNEYKIMPDTFRTFLPGEPWHINFYR